MRKGQKVDVKGEGMRETIPEEILQEAEDRFCDDFTVMDLARLMARNKVLEEALASMRVEGFWSLDGKQPTHWVIYQPIKDDERSLSIAAKRELLAALWEDR